jgi:hypothetical protein
MAVVLIVAVDLATIRLPLSGRPINGIALVLGGVPMANLLALALLSLIAERPVRLPDRRFWLGFEIAGALALLVFVWVTLTHPDAMLNMLSEGLRSMAVPGRWMFPAAALALLAPQVLLALLGGYLSERLVRSGARLAGSASGV